MACSLVLPSSCSSSGKRVLKVSGAKEKNQKKAELPYNPVLHLSDSDRTSGNSLPNPGSGYKVRGVDVLDARPVKRELGFFQCGDIDPA